MSSKTHTIQLSDSPNAPGEIEAMPLRIKIGIPASGHVFTIQASAEGIRVSVEQSIVLRPNASNAIKILASDF